jgi:hypothetical protein
LAFFSRPLKHLKASIDTLTASTDTLAASTDTLTASKALSRPLQGINSQVLSHGCESVAEAKKVPVDVVRKPVGKTVLKILEQIKTFWFCSKIFRLNGKVLLLF